MIIDRRYLLLFRSFFLLIALYAIYGIIVSIFYDAFPDFQNPKYAQDSVRELLEESPQMAFLLIVILAPLIEEMMFRTLIVPSHLDIILFIAVWPLYLVMYFIPADVHIIVKLVFLTTFLVSIVYIGKQLITPRQTLRARQSLRKYKYVVWVLASLIFGFVHITNYVSEFKLDVALFLLILPRIFAGFMCGYVKMRNKQIAFPIMLHALNNGFAFSLIHLAGTT